TLLLAPDASPFVSLDITRDIHTRIPDCELQVFAGARHGLACSHGGTAPAPCAAFSCGGGLPEPAPATADHHSLTGDPGHGRTT
ncbi:MAG: hypothetical protein O6934_12325, partial [SAR324 cluster bacterium]|nr:hypothetical protein [SAR324 cluster bacterium]